ncbi:MAG: hypothetical protein WBR26_15105 [Candidatus Acidiferrum sp.]
MSKRPYRLLVTWSHRKWGPQVHRTVEDASSIRRAANQALSSFFKDKNKRKERADAHVALQLSVQRLKRPGCLRAKHS